MTKLEKLNKKLKYDRKHFWKEFPQTEHRKAMDFCTGYKEFLDNCKTDRESIEITVKKAIAHNFSNLDSKPEGKQIYRSFRAKNAALAIIGKAPISSGVNLIVSHIDAPRVDLKQNPLYEDGKTSLGMMRTHYYGGVKKYQWMSTPLSLHGVFIKLTGKSLKLISVKMRMTRFLSCLICFLI